MTGEKEKEGEGLEAVEVQEDLVAVVAADDLVIVEVVDEAVDLDAKPIIELLSKIFPPEHLGRI